MAKKKVEVGELTVYDAYASPGTPVCMYATNGAEESEIQSVSVYTYKDEIIGVGVYGPDGKRVVGAGYLPTDDETA